MQADYTSLHHHQVSYTSNLHRSVATLSRQTNKMKFNSVLIMVAAAFSVAQGAQLDEISDIAARAPEAVAQHPNGPPPNMGGGGSGGGSSEGSSGGESNSGSGSGSSGSSNNNDNNNNDGKAPCSDARAVVLD